MRILCVALVLLGSGCRKSESTTTGKTPAVKAKVKGDAVVIQNGNGTVTLGSGRIPEGFPLAVMPGAEVVGSAHMSPADGEEVFQLSLTAPDDVKSVADFYAKELKSKGLKVSRTDQTSDDTVMVILVGESERVQAGASVIREGAAGPTNVAISWSLRKQ